MSKQVIEGINFRDRLYTVDEKGKRKWVRSKKPKGDFYNKRTLLSLFYLGIFFIMPFIRVNDRPFMMINLPERKFILFTFPFGPQDMILFGLVMVTSLVFISLFTVAFGRIFCGWVCPQTVFMELVFRKIEYLFEGSPKQQVELKDSQWNFNKVWRKFGKHITFWGLSFIIANTFLAYIITTDKLFLIVTEPISKHIVGFISICIFTTVFYTVFSFVREQVCTIICPYGRLQGVLIDNDSLVVAYDYRRGEPRGMQKKNSDEIKGDCIDCKECVKVCPTGIDIRNGTQLECINCTACIDACDGVMLHMEKPKGLIRYASTNNIENKSNFSFTWRVKAYTIVLSVLILILTSLIITRKEIDSTLMRAGGQLFQTLPDGKVSNLYSIQIVNKTYKNESLQLKLKDLPGEIKIVGKPELLVNKDNATNANFFIILDQKYLKTNSNKLVVLVLNNGKVIEELKTTFFAP